MAGLPILDNDAAKEPVASTLPPPAPHVPGKLERALGDVWSLARRRVDTLGHWRETIALRRRFSLQMLRVEKLKVAVPGRQTPNCEDCVDICCTGPNAIVSLRLRDIASLVDAGLERAIVPRDTLAGAAPVFAVDSTARAAKLKSTTTWARREADGSVFHQVFPVLARDATGTCTLLTEDRLCGAYPGWPLSCARYPYALDLESKVVFYAKGCTSVDIVRAPDAPIRVRNLLRGVVDAYNERVKDAVMLYMARKELADLGLLRFLDTSRL